MLECVVNVSEGRDGRVIASIASAAGSSLLDVHSDPDHHRTVLTLAGLDVEAAVRAVARRTIETIDLRRHEGVHPRLGALDVVPFVPLGSAGDARADLPLDPAVGARDRFAEWAGTELGLPCFVYGPERCLPDVRRRAFRDVGPDTGPVEPDARSGACAVGARPCLVAYTVWLASSDLGVAQRSATAVRTPGLRALGLACGRTVQVSCNLTDPFRLGPADAYDRVTAEASQAGFGVERAELVGLAPRRVVEAIPSCRWNALDLDPERTIESRLGRLPAS